LEEKLEKITDNYITMLLEHPDLPIFVLSEIRSNPEQLANRLQARKQSDRIGFYQAVDGEA
jgi:hypothetical protein